MWKGTEALDCSHIQILHSQTHQTLSSLKLHLLSPLSSFKYGNMNAWIYIRQHRFQTHNARPEADPFPREGEEEVGGQIYWI